MITSHQLEQALLRQLDGTPCFLVSAEVRPGGKAVVEVDNDQAVTLAELTAVNKALRDELGEALDDMELQVGSPGVGRPFKVERQYRKHVGHAVELAMKDGTVLQGRLESFSPETIELRMLQAAKVKGRLPKLAEGSTAIPTADIRSTQAAINHN